MAVAMALISAAFASCKSSSCGCDSFGAVITEQQAEVANA